MLIHRRVVNNLIGNPAAEWGNVGEFHAIATARSTPNKSQTPRLAGW